MTFDHLGGFYGDHLQQTSRDVLLMKHIPTRRWGVLSDLNTRKWYGYRFIDPATCLWVFADRFRRASLTAYGQGYQQRRPIPRGKTGKGNRPTHAAFRMNNMITQIDRQHVAGLFSGMCVADDLGIPYDFFCKHAIEFYDRALKKLPMPGNITEDRVVVHVQEAWKAHLEAPMLVTTDDPHYAVRNFDHHPWQFEYMDFLLDQIGTRSNPKYSLAQVCFKNPQVLPSYAASKIGPELVLAARETL